MGVLEKLNGVSVSFDHKVCVFFRFNGITDNDHWVCATNIARWLRKQKIDYDIVQFTKFFVKMKIQDAGARLLIKLTFPANKHDLKD